MNTEYQRALSEWTDAGRDKAKAKAAYRVTIGTTSLLSAVMLVLLLLLLTGCATPHRGEVAPTPTTDKRVALQAYLTQHGYPITSSEELAEYEQSVVSTCTNADTNPAHLTTLATLTRQNAEASALTALIRTGIEIYCPEHLTEWDQATN